MENNIRNNVQGEQMLNLNKVCIESTRDYDKFSLPMIGNRGVVEANVKKLVASMSKKQLASIAVVNSDGEIIDGQHRYRACKQLGLPFNYIVMDDYGIEEVHMLNTNMKNWSNEDFVKQFSDRYRHGESQYLDYYKVDAFMSKHRLKLSQALILLENGKKTGSSKLREGTFTVSVNPEEAEENLMELQDLEKELGTKLVNTLFWQSYVLCKQVKGFSASYFYKKAKKMKDEVEDTKATVENMIDTFEDIYNFNNRKEISIAFVAKSIYKKSLNKKASHDE